MTPVTTYEALLSHLKSLDSRILVIEGARCTGKDFLIQWLLRDIAGARSFELLHPRKRFLDKTTGSVKLPAGLNVQHGHLWALDCLRQLDDTFILNRGMLSGQYFDPPNKEVMGLWANLLEQIGGHVVLLCPNNPVHASRIRSAGRSAEATSIYAEKTGLLRLAQQLPTSLLTIFSESLDGSSPTR